MPYTPITTTSAGTTGTAGVFGSAAAAGKLLDLNEQQMVWALGLAASQPVACANRSAR